jgi:hypothetical protein
VERYLWQVTSRYQFEWLTRPGVIVIGVIIVIVVGFSLFGREHESD